MIGMPSANASQWRLVSPGRSQSAAKIVYAPMIPRPTYESFIPIRLWTNSIPSTSTISPSRTATLRRRNSSRARTYRNRAMSTPAMTPGARQANACRPIGTDTTWPPASIARSCWRSPDGYSWFSSMTIAAGANGRRASP